MGRHGTPVGVMGARPTMIAVVVMLYTLGTIVAMSVYSWGELSMDPNALLVVLGMGGVLNIAWMLELTRMKNRIAEDIYTYARLAILTGLPFYVTAFATQGFLYFYDRDELAVQTATSLSLVACPFVYIVLLYHVLRRYINE